MDRHAHWQGVYSSKDEADVSWFQDTPETSARLVCAYARPGASVIDAGGGASRLAGHLLEHGYRVTVLDIAEAALAKARSRLGEQAAAIAWVTADVTTWRPTVPFDLWHDRAVFHFLTQEKDRASYAAAMAAAVRQDGYAIIGTFALNGPDRCSGLPICRYDAKSLAAEFARDFILVEELVEQHLTPAGAVQMFQFVVLRRLTGLD